MAVMSEPVTVIIELMHPTMPLLPVGAVVITPKTREFSLIGTAETEFSAESPQGKALQDAIETGDGATVFRIISERVKGARVVSLGAGHVHQMVQAMYEDRVAESNRVIDGQSEARRRLIRKKGTAK